jgi:hypothetical protein
MARFLRTIAWYERLRGRRIYRTEPARLRFHVKVADVCAQFGVPKFGASNIRAGILNAAAKAAKPIGEG